MTSRSWPTAALACLAVLTGCSSSDLPGSSKPATPQAPGASPSFSDKMGSLLFSPYAPTANATPGTTQPAEPDCPGVDVRKGASTYAVGATPKVEVTAATTRYQATISQTARECAVVGATMTIKVGVQGRVILGPAGGPGQFDVPLRYAVVREGTDPKTIVTKLRRVPVAVPADQTGVPFIDVEQDLTFPLPANRDLDNYIVYVGFDALSAPEKPARGKKKSQKVAADSYPPQADPAATPDRPRRSKRQRPDTPPQ